MTPSFRTGVHTSSGDYNVSIIIHRGPPYSTQQKYCTMHKIKTQGYTQKIMHIKPKIPITMIRHYL